MPHHSIQIGIVDDHSLYREGLAKLINGFLNCRVVLQAGNGFELQAAFLKSDHPDVLLLDLRMPKMDGFQTLTWMQEHFPEIPVIILTMFECEHTIMQLVGMGAVAYLKKNIEASELEKVLHIVMSGGYYFNEYISPQLIRKSLNVETKRVIEKVLTVKELSFLRLAATNLTYKGIANEMTISTRAVDKIRCHLFEKMEVSSRVDMVVHGIKNGLVELGMFITFWLTDSSPFFSICI